MLTKGEHEQMSETGVNDQRSKIKYLLRALAIRMGVGQMLWDRSECVEGGKMGGDRYGGSGGKDASGKYMVRFTKKMSDNEISVTGEMSASQCFYFDRISLTQKLR